MVYNLFLIANNVKQALSPKKTRIPTAAEEQTTMELIIKHNKFSFILLSMARSHLKLKRHELQLMELSNKIPAIQMKMPMIIEIHPKVYQDYHEPRRPTKHIGGQQHPEITKAFMHLQPILQLISCKWRCNVTTILANQTQHVGLSQKDEVKHDAQQPLRSLSVIFRERLQQHAKDLSLIHI